MVRPEDVSLRRQRGAFPKLFAKVHPTYKTPTNAIFAQMILTLGSGLIAGAIWNSQVAFFLLSGLVLVIGVAFVYLMANVGVIVYYWRERRAEFNWLWHFILPVVSSLVLIYALYVRAHLMEERAEGGHPRPLRMHRLDREYHRLDPRVPGTSGLREAPFPDGGLPDRSGTTQDLLRKARTPRRTGALNVT